MFYQLIKYFEFILKSTNKHGVHSPFVYDLVTKCFEAKLPNKIAIIISEYRNNLQQNKSKINVTDFGAGSRVFESNERVVSEIVRNVTISKKHAKLLTRLVLYFNCKNILELGTSLGVGTLSLALGNKSAIITTLEGCPETLLIPKKNLENYISNTINFVEGAFSKTLSDTLLNTQYDLVYFDGNHQKKPTIAYFEACLSTINNETLFIFDDIYWSKEMTEAWNYIKNHEKVTLTIDTYHLGFVFFRKEQFEKEHFIIRL